MDWHEKWPQIIWIFVTNVELMERQFSDISDTAESIRESDEEIDVFM